MSDFQQISADWLILAQNHQNHENLMQRDRGQNYTLEWFSEAGSAPIRSAVKFYFEIDVRIFFNFFKNIFGKKSEKSRFQKSTKSENFSKI